MESHPLYPYRRFTRLPWIRILFIYFISIFEGQLTIRLRPLPLVSPQPVLVWCNNLQSLGQATLGYVNLNLPPPVDHICCHGTERLRPPDHLKKGWNPSPVPWFWEAEIIGIGVLRTLKGCFLSIDRLWHGLGCWRGPQRSTVQTSWRHGRSHSVVTNRTANADYK